MWCGWRGAWPCTTGRDEWTKRSERRAFHSLSKKKKGGAVVNLKASLRPHIYCLTLKSRTLKAVLDSFWAQCIIHDEGAYHCINFHKVKHIMVFIYNRSKLGSFASFLASFLLSFQSVDKICGRRPVRCNQYLKICLHITINIEVNRWYKYVKPFPCNREVFGVKFCLRQLALNAGNAPSNVAQIL